MLAWHRICGDNFLNTRRLNFLSSLSNKQRVSAHCKYPAYSLLLKNPCRLDDAVAAAYYVVYHYCIPLRNVQIELFVYSHLTRHSMTVFFQSKDIYIEVAGKLLCPTSPSCIGRHCNGIVQVHLGGVLCKERYGRNILNARKVGQGKLTVYVNCNDMLNPYCFKQFRHQVNAHNLAFQKYPVLASIAKVRNYSTHVLRTIIRTLFCHHQ